MLDEALELKWMLGFKGNHTLTSHSFVIHPDELAEGQSFKLRGDTWLIESAGPHSYYIVAAHPFNGSHEAVTGRHTRWYIFKERLWEITGCIHRNLTRKEIKEKYSCVSCGNRIILVWAGAVRGYIEQRGANEKDWLELHKYLCEFRSDLLVYYTRTNKPQVGYTSSITCIKDQYGCLLHDDAILLTQDHKVVGKIVQCEFNNDFWAAVKYYLLEMP